MKSTNHLSARMIGVPLIRLSVLALFVSPLGLVSLSASAGEQHKAPHVYDFRQDAKLDKYKRHKEPSPHKGVRPGKHKVSSQRVRDWRADRRNGLGNWRGYEPHTDRARLARLRHESHERAERLRRQRQHQSRHVSGRHNRNSWTSYSWNPFGRQNYYGYNNGYTSTNRWWDRHDWDYWRTHRWHHPSWRSGNWRRYPYRPWRSGRTGTGWYSHYASPLGISFVFGSNGSSRYRWASNPYRFYQPQYGSRLGYRDNTWCERVLVDARHYGHTEIVSVLQCSNPWDGTYIIEGSELVVDCPYGRD